MIRRGVAHDIGDVDGRDHGEMKHLDRLGKVDAVSELFGCGPSGLVGGGRRDCGADFARCCDERRVGAAGWAGELAPAFGRSAPGNLVALQRRRQPLNDVAINISLSGGSFGDNAGGATDEGLQTGHPNQIRRIRVAG
jgi:hypothetical protein